MAAKDYKVKSKKKKWTLTCKPPVTFKNVDVHSVPNVRENV